MSRFNDDTTPKPAKLPGCDANGSSASVAASWLKPAEAADRARLSTSYFLRMVRQGQGPAHVGKGRLMRFRTSAVDEWIAAGGGSQAEMSAVARVPLEGRGAASPTDETGLSDDEGAESATKTDAPEAIKNRSEVRTKLRQLETDYNREDSAVYVWEALDLAERNGINRPGWVEDYLVRAAARLMQILNDVAAGKGIGRQADEVGRALGFGPGGGCRFKKAARLERDRIIYHSVEKKVGAGIKLDAARFEVAKDMDLSSATIERSHKRIAERDG